MSLLALECSKWSGGVFKASSPSILSRWQTLWRSTFDRDSNTDSSGDWGYLFLTGMHDSGCKVSVFSLPPSSWSPPWVKKKGIIPAAKTPRCMFTVCWCKDTSAEVAVSQGENRAEQHKQHNATRNLIQRFWKVQSWRVLMCLMMFQKWWRPTSPFFGEWK